MRRLTFHIDSLRIPVLAALALAVACCSTLPALAQAVQQGVSLTHPNAAVGNKLETLRTPEPRIALYRSDQTAAHAPGVNSARMVQDAVYQWELLLLGLNLPYDLITDRDLAHGVAGRVQLLILPAAEGLSGSQRKAIRKFVEDGGGIIASGRVGMFDERGNTEGFSFFRDLFGADFATNLPEQPSGIYQTLDGGHPLTDGVPMAFRLNLAPQVPMGAARVVNSRALGRLFPYTWSPTDAGPDPFADVTMALYGNRGTGHVVWFRFNPQDVSREADQQQAYQSVVINAMAYAAQVPSVALAPWPNGQQSATVFAALPLIGSATAFDAGTRRALDALSAANVPGTFFVTSHEAAQYPDLLQRIARTGELAVSANTDDVLKNQNADQQTRRLQQAQRDLAGAGERPLIGLYPPGGFFDVNTALAMQHTGFRYLFQQGVGQSAAPAHLAWRRDADYRENLLADASGTGNAVRSRAMAGDRLYTFFATTRDDYTVLNLMNQAGNPSGQLEAYRDDFIRVHDAHGLYVLPYHAETQALSTERARVLTDLATLAQRQGSWVTTLSDVYGWWIQREQLGILVTDATDRSVTFEVTNAGNQAINGATVAVRLGRPVRSASLNVNTQVTVNPDGESVTAIIPVLRSGSNRFTLSFN